MEIQLLIYPFLLLAILLVVRFKIIHKLAPVFNKQGWDKIGHLLLYFTATVVLAFLLTDLNVDLKYLYFPMCVVGILHEISHYKNPNRNFEFMDLAANFMGVVLAYFLIQIIF